MYKHVRWGSQLVPCLFPNTPNTSAEWPAFDFHAPRKNRRIPKKHVQGETLFMHANCPLGAGGDPLEDTACNRPGPSRFRTRRVEGHPCPSVVSCLSSRNVPGSPFGPSRPSDGPSGLGRFGRCSSHPVLCQDLDEILRCLFSGSTDIQSVSRLCFNSECSTRIPVT